MTSWLFQCISCRGILDAIFSVRGLPAWVNVLAAGRLPSLITHVTCVCPKQEGSF